MPITAERRQRHDDDDRGRRRNDRDPLPPRDSRVFNENGQLEDDSDYYIVQAAQFRHTFLGGGRIYLKVKPPFEENLLLRRANIS